MKEETPSELNIEFVGQYHHDIRYRRTHLLFYVPELLKIAIRSLKCIVSFRPHAVHIFTAHPSSLLLLVVLRFFGYRVYIDLDDLNSTQAQAAGYSRIAVRIYSALEKTIPSFARKVTVCSHYLQKKYPGSILLPNMYDKEDFSHLPIRSDRKRGWTTVIYLGMMGLYHGEKEIIKCIPSMLNQEKKLRFVFIGWGEDEADARALARHLKISRYIRFTGRIPYRRAVKWLSRSDIGLLPMEDTSLFRARHPLKMLDYMAAGVCCLASNVGEARHFIKNRFSGILVPPGDMSELSQKIVYLSHHPAIRERIAQEGQKAISVLEVGRHIHRWASLYRNS